MKNFRLILPLLASFLILAALVPATTVNGAELTAEFQITNLTKKEYQDEHKWELYVNEAVTFDSSSSTDDVDFIWDFGDGTEKNTTQSITVSHIYENTGEYTVNLTIRDKNDENKTDSIKGTLLIVKRPKAVLVIRDANTGKPITANQTIASGQKIIMDASDSEGNIKTYSYGYNLDNVFIAHYMSANNNFTLKYSTEKEYKLGLKVADNIGTADQMESDEFIVLTVNEKPTAHIDSISLNPALDTNDVEFKGHGTDVGTIERYVWRSSINNEIHNSTECNFSASELSNGTHTIFFKVQDNYSVWSDEVSITLTINPQEKKETDISKFLFLGIIGLITILAIALGVKRRKTSAVIEPADPTSGSTPATTSYSSNIEIPDKFDSFKPPKQSTIPPTPDYQQPTPPPLTPPPQTDAISDKKHQTSPGK